METSLSPVGILPEAAEILAMRTRLAEIADRLAAASYNVDASPGEIRGAARTAEAASAAADAVFNLVSTASSYADCAASKAAIAERVGSVFAGGA